MGWDGGFKRLAIGSMYVVAFIFEFALFAGLFCHVSAHRVTKEVTGLSASYEGSNRFICEL